MGREYSGLSRKVAAGHAQRSDGLTMRIDERSPSQVTLRRAAAALWDVTCWFAATVALAGARYDFALDRVQWELSLIYPVAASASMLALGYTVGLYRGHFRVGSFQEAFRLAFTGAVITLFLAVMF